MAALFACGIFLPQAAHAYRADWEAHNGSDITGGMRGTIHVMSPSATCSNVDPHCLFEGLTPTYDFTGNEGAVGAGWLKMKDATSNWRVWDAFLFYDKAIAYRYYTLAYEETSNVPVDRFFRVGKTTTDGSGTTWYRYVFQSAGSGSGTGQLAFDTVTFTNLSFAQPRNSAWTGNSATELSTSGIAATFSGVEARELAGSTYHPWDNSAITKLCHTDSPYWGHNPSHTATKIIHFGRSSVSGESNDCTSSYPDTYGID